MPDLKKLLSVLLLCCSAIQLIGLQQKIGWLLLGLGALNLLLVDRKFAKDLLLLYIAVSILGLTPITTNISYSHMAIMSLDLLAAVALPYLISKYIFKDTSVKYKFHHVRKWYKSEILYILFTAAIAYFLVPFYLKNTGAYLNWPSATDTSSIIRLFIGTNGLGIWDELFFVITVLAILRKHFKFAVANLAQASIFTSFLYELGFTGWGPVLIFIFALLQGYIFKKTESILYVVSIHLTLDLILFLALINSHHPNLINIFLT